MSKSTQHWHGRCSEGATWALPIKTSSPETDTHRARPGYSNVSSCEFQDVHEVFLAKAALLARMLRAAKCCVVYSGAGISTSAGVDDYATRDAGTLASRPMVHPYDAEPTPAHFVLARMGEVGLLKGGWVQQNHDGLPQKAGFSQVRIEKGLRRPQSITGDSRAFVFTTQ